MVDKTLIPKMWIKVFSNPFLMTRARELNIWQPIPIITFWNLNHEIVLIVQNIWKYKEGLEGGGVGVGVDIAKVSLTFGGNPF